MKNQKGITLIALVITIIVLLILAGVSISMVIGNNGILNQANTAKKLTQEASEKEQVELAYLSAKTKNLGGSVTVATLNEALRENQVDATATEPVAGKIQVVFSNGNKYDVEDELVIKVENSTGDGETGTGSTATTPVTKTLSDLKVGDYVKYDTGTSCGGENGVMLCRVLYPMDSEYGLQIISDQSVSQLGLSWGVGGAYGYNYSFRDLKIRAELYLNLNYAVGARSVGSLPDSFDDNACCDYDTTSLGNIGGSYCAAPDTNSDLDWNQMSTNNLHICNEEYWLASRSAYTDMTSYELGVRFVTTAGMRDTKLLWADTLKDAGCDNIVKGFRPCILLRNDLKITGGTGADADNAYTLGL